MNIVFAESCDIGAKVRDTALAVSISTDKPPWSTPIDTLRHMQVDQVLSFKVGAVCRLWLWSSAQAAGLFPVNLHTPGSHPEAVDCGQVEVKAVRVRCLATRYAPDEHGLEHSFDFRLEVVGRVNLDVLVAEPANDVFLTAVLAERRRLWALLTGKAFAAATLDYISNERMSVQQLELPLSNITLVMPGAVPASQPAPNKQDEPTRVDTPPEPRVDADGVVLEDDDGQVGPFLLGYEAPEQPVLEPTLLDYLWEQLCQVHDQVAPFGWVASWAGFDCGLVDKSDELLRQLQLDGRFVVDGRVSEGIEVGLADRGAGAESLTAVVDAIRLVKFIEDGNFMLPPKVRHVEEALELSCDAVWLLATTWSDVFDRHGKPSAEGWSACSIAIHNADDPIEFRIVRGYLKAKSVVTQDAKSTRKPKAPLVVPTLDAEALNVIVECIKVAGSYEKIDRINGLPVMPATPKGVSKREFGMLVLEQSNCPDLVLERSSDPVVPHRVSLAPAVHRAHVREMVASAIEFVAGGGVATWKAGVTRHLVKHFGVQNAHAHMITEDLVKLNVLEHQDAGGFGPLVVRVSDVERATDRLLGVETLAPVQELGPLVDEDGVVLDGSQPAGETQTEQVDIDPPDRVYPASHHRKQWCDAVHHYLTNGEPASDWVESVGGLSPYTFDAPLGEDVARQILIGDGRFAVKNFGTADRPQWLVALGD